MQTEEYLTNVRVYDQFYQIRQQVSYKTLKHKFFWTVDKVFSGESLFYALWHISKQKDINRLCQQFANDDIITPLVKSDDKNFVKSPDVYYKFVVDMYSIKNFTSIWNKPPAPAEKVITDLIAKLVPLLQTVKRDINSQGFVSESNITEKMQSLNDSVCELQNVKMLEDNS